MNTLDLNTLINKLSNILNLEFKVFLVKENPNSCISWIDGQNIYLDEEWFYNNKNEMEIASIIAYEAFHFWELEAILFAKLPFEKVELWKEEFENYDCFAQDSEAFQELNINKIAVIFSEFFIEKICSNYSKKLDFDVEEIRFFESLNLFKE